MRLLQRLTLLTLATPWLCAAAPYRFLPTAPDFNGYRFVAQDSKTLPGTSAEQGSKWNCSGTLQPADTLGELALMATAAGNGCYTNGIYSHRNFPVQRGTVVDDAGRAYPAYTLGEATQKATQFVASQHVVFYKFPTREAYTVYALDSPHRALRKVLEVPAEAVTPQQFTKVVGLNASEVRGSATYVFAPSAQPLSNYTPLANGVEGAKLASPAELDVAKFRYSVSGQPFDSATGFNNGPDSHANTYSHSRQFFLLRSNAGQLGILWQNKADKHIQITWLSSRGSVTLPLDNPRNELLAAATDDPQGNLYYVTAQDGDGSATDTPRTLTLFKASGTGTALASQALDTNKAALNFVRFSGVASLKYANGQLALMIGHTMHKSADGLNHQRGLGVIVDAATLALRADLGQTSGHSFENVLTVNTDQQFIGMDLADNYPRGIHLHLLREKNRVGRVVYTYKTQMMTRPGTAEAGKPQYWSNDNRTYTELGDLVETPQGYSIFFIGEPDAAGRSLNNTRVGAPLNDARNIGLVRVVRQFDAVPQNGNVVEDALMQAPGNTETGSFYTFGGSPSAQRNTGVSWLTRYSDKAQTNASRLRAAPLEDGRVLLLWEVWTPSTYVNTYAMTLDRQGKALSAPLALGPMVRIHRRDDLLVMGNRVYLVNGSAADSRLELVEIGVR